MARGRKQDSLVVLLHNSQIAALYPLISRILTDRTHTALAGSAKNLWI